MDDADRYLLSWLDNGIPFEAQPFRVIAGKINLDAAEVLLRISRLKELGVIGKLRAVIDSQKLGFKHYEVAVLVPESERDSALCHLQSKPEIYRIFEYEHPYNFWCSLALAPDLSTEDFVAGITSHWKTLLLRIKKRFKQPVQKGVSPEVLRPKDSDGKKKGIEISEIQKQCLAVLEQDFPLKDYPYRFLAESCGVSENQFLETIRQLQKSGVLKKISGVRKKAISADSLILWQIPEERRKVLAEKIAAMPGIRACYEATSSSEFPYSLYSMIAADSPEDCEQTAGKIEKEIGAWPHQSLWFKQSHLEVPARYFRQNERFQY